MKTIIKIRVSPEEIKGALGDYVYRVEHGIMFGESNLVEDENKLEEVSSIITTYINSKLNEKGIKLNDVDDVIADFTARYSEDNKMTAEVMLVLL